MKAFVVLIILVAAGLVGYNYFTTGEISLIPAALQSSPEEQELDKLAKAFYQGKRKYTEGGVGASVAGMDTPADVEGAIRDIKKVKSQVVTFKNRMKEAKVRKKAENLLDTINEFLDTYGIEPAWPACKICW